MKTPFSLLLPLAALLISKECSAFGLQPRTTMQNPPSAQLYISSHASSPEPVSTAIQHPEAMAMPLHSNDSSVKSKSDEENEMAIMVSIAGLTMLAMMLAMGDSGGALVGQNLQHNLMADEGSVATLIVDAFFLAIAGVVSLVSGDNEGESSSRR